MLYVASTDVESVKPTLQRKGRDGLLLITKQPSPHLPMAGSSRPIAVISVKPISTNVKVGGLLADYLFGRSESTSGYASAT